MKTHITTIIAGIVCATMLMASCQRINIDQDTLVGSWQQPVDGPLPSLTVTIEPDGMAHFNYGPGCFGDPVTLSYRWTLVNNNSKVHFAYRYNSNGTEEMRPDLEWKILAAPGDKLVVDEQTVGDISSPAPNIITYLRQ